ncbi:MAG: hypothetical protein ACI4OL_06235 [Gemmiger sp.]
MKQAAVCDFFLGALAPGGFTGWFREATGEPDVRTYLIKSGPGCGKSTLMKRLADAGTAKGFAVQRLHCSSDPQSLDGVLLPGALILDATAPHTLDCKFPGAAECVVSLYHTLDEESLWQQREEILRLGAYNAEQMQQAAGYFALACGLLQRRRICADAALDRPKAEGFARRLAARTLPLRKNAVPGKRQIRLLSAPTPGGPTVWYDTIPALADTIYAIHDPYGAASNCILQTLSRCAVAGGCDVIECRCPTDQAGKIDHLFLPARRVAFVTACTWHPMLFAGQKNIHASRWYDSAVLAKQRAFLRYEKQTATELIDRACEAQSAAKSAHDQLEQFYISAADFAAVDQIYNTLCRKLLNTT